MPESRTYPLFALLRDIALIVFVIVYCIHTLG